MGLWELLAHWGSAEKLQDKDVVFGLYAIWWARIGLAMQLVGALGVVADILGADKIKSRLASIAGFTRRGMNFCDRHWRPMAVLIAVFLLCTVIVLWLPPLLPQDVTLKVKHAFGLFGLFIAAIVMVVMGAYTANAYISLMTDILSSSPLGPLVKVMAYGLPVVGTILVILTS